MANLQQIRERVRQRADIQGETARYPDAELNGYINGSYKELWGLLVRSSLVRDEASQTIVADGSATYALPVDHYSTIAVFRVYGTEMVKLERDDQSERPHGAPGARTGTADKYRTARVAGAKTMELSPRPSNGSYIHSYIPAPADLTLETDSVESVLAWDEYIVIDAAIKCLRKEDSSTTALKQDKAEIFVRIKEESEDQEEGKLGCIKDVSGDSDWTLFC